jgi:hypothetical protein
MPHLPWVRHHTAVRSMDQQLGRSAADVHLTHLQELDIPFGRPPLAAADIVPGEVSPSSQQEAPATPELAGSHPLSAAATAAVSTPASAFQAVPQLANLHASDAIASADADQAAAAASPAAQSDAVSAGSAPGTEWRADSSSRSQGSQQAAPDLVEQRSLSLRTVRTAPSEGAAQDDSPVVWCVHPAASLHDCNTLWAVRTLTLHASPVHPVLGGRSGLQVLASSGVLNDQEFCSNRAGMMTRGRPCSTSH